MEREAQDASRGYRLHPLSPLFEIGRSFVSLVVPGLIVLFLSVGDSYEPAYMVLFIPAMLSSFKHYLFLRYSLTSEHLVVREGMFFKKTRHVPYARIQNIDTVQNPLHRILGVVEVRIETASGSEPEAVLRVLSLVRLEAIRAGVFEGRGIARTEGQDVPERSEPSPFFRMTPVDVAYFGLLSQKGLVLLTGLVFLVWEFNLTERLVARLPVEPDKLSSLLPVWIWAALGLAFVALLQALTVAWAFITLHDFHVSRAEDDLRTTCGLWTRQSATLPRHRIQFLSVQESWLQRCFGRISIKALTAGGDSTSDSQVSRKWLVPLVERAALGRILEEVQPDVSFSNVDWKAVHPRARRRMLVKWTLVSMIPVALVARNSAWWAAGALGLFVCLGYVLAAVRWKRLRYSVTETGVLLSDGITKHVRHAVRFAKIQSVSMTQTPFDRWHRMATVRVDTAGRGDAGLALSIPYLDLRVARRLSRLLRSEAAAKSFRW